MFKNCISKNKFLSFMLVLSMLLTIITTAYFSVSHANSYKPTIKNLSIFKKELQKVIDKRNYKMKNPKVDDLIKKTEPKVLKQFLDEKFDRIKQINYSDISDKKIDLGDGCFIQKSTSHQKEKELFSSKGAETLWKKYGARQYTSYYDLFLVLGWFELDICNHYTLSSRGITPRYVEAYSSSSALISVSHGSVHQPKRYAKKGKTVSSNCAFKITVGLGKAGIYTRNFKMYNYIKCSDIDTRDREVKVVQFWRGEWL